MVATLIVASAIIVPVAAVGTDGAGLRSGTASANGISVSYIDSVTEGYGILSITYDQEPKGTFFNVVIDGKSTASFRKANLEGLLIEGGLSIGTHTISVRSDADETRTVTLVVGIEVVSITLDKTEAVMKKGSSLGLKASISPDEATVKTVMWSSSDANVASVDSNGIVTAVNGGTTTITAESGCVTATCNITVIVDVTDISLNTTERSMKRGESYELAITIMPSDATDKTVTWTSSDVTVATVSANGVISAVGPGTAVITADVGGKTVSCAINVTVGVSSVQLNLSERSLTTGESFILLATVLPSDATDKAVTWTSSNLTVASVGSDGTVRAIGEGIAVITATADGIESTCVVTVTPYSAPDDSTITQRTNEDGSTTTTVEKQTINEDGTRVETKKETTTSADGNSVSTIETLIVKDDSGDVISSTNTATKIITNDDGAKTEMTETEVKTSDGAVLKMETEKKTTTDGKVTEERKLSLTDGVASTDASTSVGVDGSIDGTSVTTVSIVPVKTEEKAEYRVDSAVSSAVIGHMNNVSSLVGSATPTVRVIADDTLRTAEFILSVELIDKVSGSNGTLEISSSNGTILMDHGTVSSMVDMKEVLTVQISNVDKGSELNSEQRNKVSANSVVRLVVYANGTEIHNFGGNVTVSIPYVLPNGTDPADVSAWYLDDDGGLTDMGGKYDSESGLVTFITTHFSMYVVGVMDDNSGTVGHGNSLLFIIVAVIAVLLIVMISFVYLRKRMEAE